MLWPLMSLWTHCQCTAQLCIPNEGCGHNRSIVSYIETVKSWAFYVQDNFHWLHFLYLLSLWNNSDNKWKIIIANGNYLGRKRLNFLLFRCKIRYFCYGHNPHLEYTTVLCIDNEFIDSLRVNISFKKSIDAIIAQRSILLR
jgi:hypothetical protein